MSFPWDAAIAKADELTGKFEAQQQQISKQQTQIDAVLQQSQQQGCIAWQLLRDRYQADEKAAQDELNGNPVSVTLQRARDDAKAKVTAMDAKLNAPPCA